MIVVSVFLAFLLNTPMPMTTPMAVEHLVTEAITSDSLEASRAPLIPFLEEIEDAANEHHIPAALIAAIVQEESAFNEWAEKSETTYERNARVRREARRWSCLHRGIPSYRTELLDRARSMGPMQVMGEIARAQGFQERYLSALFLPQNSIEQGALLLRHLLDRYHRDTLAAISAYNQGPARRHHGVFENSRYVYRVSIAWRAYKKLFSTHLNLSK